jgi:membrane protease YdiL (CAAX protease family)
VRALLAAEITRIRTSLRAIDDAARAAPVNHAADRKLVIIIVTAGVSLLLLQYYGTRHGPGALLTLFVDDGARVARRFFEEHPRGEYWRFAWWLGSVQLTYAVIPLTVVLVARPRFTLVDVGLGRTGALSHWKLYATLLAFVLVPVVVLASQPGFASFYPMYKGARLSTAEFIAWELIYLPSFFAVELFFRGILLFPFRRRFGSLAVLVPVVPYMMIHFGKPVLEAGGAVFAALVLGTAALVSGNIWLGVVVHVVVALTMDCFAVFFAS